MQWVIYLRGNASIIGPFDSRLAAQEWGGKHIDGQAFLQEWEALPFTNPEDYLAPK